MKAKLAAVLVASIFGVNCGSLDAVAGTVTLVEEETVRPLSPRAIKVLERLAEAGAVDLQFELGTMYRAGQGVTVDYKKAQHWYREAALNRNAAAQASLANMLERGQGSEPDVVSAYAWNTLSAEHRLNWGGKAALEGLRLKLTPEQLREAELLIARLRRDIDERR